jgi:hypothetical protein
VLGISGDDSSLEERGQFAATVQARAGTLELFDRQTANVTDDADHPLGAPPDCLNEQPILGAV